MKEELKLEYIEIMARSERRLRTIYNEMVMLRNFGEYSNALLLAICQLKRSRIELQNLEKGVDS